MEMIRLSLARARVLAVAVLLLAVAVVTTACGDSKPSGDSQKSAASDPPRIYLLWPASDSDGDIQGQSGARTAIAKLGDKAKVTIDSGTSRADPTQLIRKLDAAITQQYDVLAINAGAVGAALVPVVKRAQAQGIKVLTFDQTIPGVDLETYIQYDGEQDGRTMGEFMKSKLPDGGDVGIIQCYAENPLIQAITKGIKAGIAGSKVKVVAELDARCDPNRARGAAENMLAAHPDLKGIFAQWDVQALGALPVIKKHGEPFALIGGGGEINAIRLIAKGDDGIDASTDAHFREIGRVTVETAFAVASGEKVAPLIHMPFELVTKDNAPEVLAGIEEVLRDKK